MNIIKMAAIALILVGLGMVYGSFSYAQKAREAQLGVMDLSAKEKRTVNVPFRAGVGVLVIGGGLMFWGSIKR